jgi:F-type H+-transporting ATPase subunit delta
VTIRTAAHRYARALFEVALAEKSDLSRIESELASVVDLFRQHAELERVLLNPAVPTPRKRAVVSQLTERLGTSSVLAKLLLLFAERDRLVVLPELLEAYRQRLLDYQNVVRAEVTTAAALSPDRARVIERTLAGATGRAVAMTTRVDPAIIGGLVARVGSTVYDASVMRQLQRMRRSLEGRD